MSDALLHKRFPELTDSLPYVRLGTSPTPIRRLDVGTGVPLWCKDDGRYGDGGWGGNKVRKLEWLLPEAHRRGARTIFTVGGTGTNWGLATALYGREQGIETVLALVDQPMDDHVRAQLRRLENSGATVHFTHTKRRTLLTAPWLYLRHMRGRKRPYYLPVGGSSPIGALGYVEGALELAEQIAAGAVPEPSHIVTAVGSGGTAAGLALGLRLAGLSTRVVGVVVNDALPLDASHIARLAGRAERLLRSRGARFQPIGLRPDDLTITTDWLGPGYGHPTPAAHEAQTLATQDGLQLETVYTAKALAAVLHLDTADFFGAGPVLFLNTYGPR
ncbi:1-aminocyclopropane-1-carboxylate deaminase/D-cysteine desulfhydrase [Nocardia sp. CS682]|uniref:1-aminocyclopropane-1-carboxylate deaminase/D-cysteine desulfhydrase n=1 Tax=Nocardia sp. CS682 TaxID=1047172 RepID=UPI0010750AAB|nr:pyridoxal-phosphate dependent enzyme [Nocardia sp. CS682]QBS45172.1 1-aminocyclopropane-1-carboxylate deaminase [Nocardia sp. CS682]